ncbi:2-dehydropantoate 2-reductase N-terminal domain-containing protein [Corynebacterium sp. H128]|uniref:ketopantoate reductase family protein n=1 Tax=Corynebacterium sp. H128 TaxID=3133427 RepID=UPI0030971846
MRILIVGAGAMGLSHGWLLSQANEVTFLVRPERVRFYDHDFQLAVHDLRTEHDDQTCSFRPAVTEVAVADRYDLVLVMVDRANLASVLPVVSPLVERIPTVFMLNHWDIEGELGQVLPRSAYLLGFPSQIGGGRDGHCLEVTVFPKGTILEAPTAMTRDILHSVRGVFESAGLHVRWQSDMAGWLAVHSMQQSLTAAPVLEAGGYENFVHDPAAVTRLVRAFKEGLTVCRRRGIGTWRLWPAALFWLPTPVVAKLMSGMFQQPETARMVSGHMRHGLADWITGLNDICTTARQLGVTTPELDAQQAVTSSWLRQTSAN